jgi:hypothetical protein
MLRRVALIGTDVSGERIAFITANIPSALILSILTMEAIRSFETPVFTKVILRHIPEDGLFSQF